MNTTTTIEKMIDSIAAVCIDLGLRGGYTPEEITDLSATLRSPICMMPCGTGRRLCMPTPRTVTAPRR